VVTGLTELLDSPLLDSLPALSVPLDWVALDDDSLPLLDSVEVAACVDSEPLVCASVAASFAAASSAVAALLAAAVVLLVVVLRFFAEADRAGSCPEDSCT
jgi:hypothetical protein